MKSIYPAKRFFRTPDFWAVLFLVGMSLALWAPRLSGPIDLRYDAGVYYILGTSLAEGKGYRLLSEPGEIQDVQYPPLLPALVAGYQKILGTSDPTVVGHWLRLTYGGLFTAFVLAAYGMARYFLAPGYALCVGVIAGLNLDTFFLSDLLFADVPYGLAACLLVILNRRGDGWCAFLGSAVAGVAAYLLRTAGIALLAAWVGESLFRKRWRQTAWRSAVAVLPVVAWHGYIRHLEAGPEYQHPVYAYQRAPYNFYNVSYAANLRLIDAFSPESGVASAKALASRCLHNLVLIPGGLGEGLAGRYDCWGGVAYWLQQNFGLENIVSTDWLAYLLVLGLGCLVLVGMGKLARRGEWFFPLFLAGSVALICLTPWPGQFTRYLGPLNPFFSLSLLLVLIQCKDWTRSHWSEDWQGLGLIPLVLVLVLILDVGITDVRGAFLDRAQNTRPLFYYNRTWTEYDRALNWLKDRAQPGEIIATWAPHWAYLWIGQQAVMPPMEPNAAEAQRLLDSVPVTYLIIDEFDFIKDLDGYSVGIKYSDQVPLCNPEQWEPIYCPDDSATLIYKRTRK